MPAIATAHDRQEEDSISFDENSVCEGPVGEDRLGASGTVSRLRGLFGRHYLGGPLQATVEDRYG